MDFSCIYRLQCKDKEVKEFYIGSTKNYTKRKRVHKNSCKNSYCKAYKFIRENGGWENWEMVVEVKTPNHTKEERIILEQIFLEIFKPKLNMGNAKGLDIKRKNECNKKKGNCPQCGKEMRKYCITRHLRNSCKS